MAIIKCKMCGGDMELTADKTFGTCEFCGSTMTLPRIDDEQRTAAFNRGNHFRRIGEFDKALAVYERIVREDDTDAEAHWCCALCRFGIEYVEDPATYEWLPTCHRASFDSFLEDVDYKAALQYSDGITRRQYMKDGAKIAEVQRGILATSQNAEPYDVFICYKETDDFGDRTRDSLLAQEIYYQLTEQGRKVFFSRITLEDVAGTQYEPYIFAALNSAKVMVVVGTKPEYLNSVWVKNEWSRFLAMMKKDRHKLLLPCYRDMDPYDMPEQLSVLQSYDMAKIGFIQDLTRGIAKVLYVEKKPAPVKETVVVQQSAAPAANIAPLLKRAFLFLEDSEWDRADDFCEQVLNMDPECAPAYIGKLMVELRVQNQSELYNQEQPFDTNNNFKKAYRFGDDTLRQTLSGYIRHINDRNENARLEGLYRNACHLMEAANNEQAFLVAAQEFEAIRSFKDAAALVKECREKAEASRLDNLYTLAKSLMVGTNIPDYLDAIRQFEALNGWRDSQEMIAACRQRIYEIEDARELARLEKLYQEARSAMEKATSEYQFKAASGLFAAIKDFRDSEVKATQCLEKAEAARLDVLYAAAKNLMTGNKISGYQEAIKRFEELGDWRDSGAQIALCHQRIKDIETQIELQRQERIRQEALKERQRIEKLYQEARKNLERANNEEMYNAAAKLFAAIGNYKDSAALAEQCRENAEIARKNALYASAKKKMSGNRVFNYEEAIKRFEELGDWKDSTELLEVCRQRIAEIGEGKVQPVRRKRKTLAILLPLLAVIVLAAVLVVFALPVLRYNNAVKLMDAGNFAEAIAAFEKVEDYENSADLLLECRYQHAVELSAAKQYEEAISAFEALNGYKNSAGKLEEAKMARLTELVQQAAVGDYITFGAYEQDNDLTNGNEAIEWLVLKKEENRSLLISKYVLDAQKYSNGNKPWSDSSLRSWLNEEFLNVAFSESARTMIPKMLVHPHGHLTLQTNQGNATWDYVFALSTQEVEELFDSESVRQCQPTAYAVAKGADVGNDNGNASWWLRTRVNGENYPTTASNVTSSTVTRDGTVDVDSISNRRGVRPALWIQPDLYVPPAEPEVPDQEPEVPTAASNATEPINEAVLAENYNRGLEQMKAGNTMEALRCFTKAGNYRDAKEQAAELRKRYQTPTTVDGDFSLMVTVQTDGTVAADGNVLTSVFSASAWNDIISVSVNNNRVLALKNDGTLVTYDVPTPAMKRVLSSWTDIVAIDSADHIVGLKADGTVVAVGSNNSGQCDVSGWNDIVAVAAGGWHTVGLKSDGTVVAVGSNSSGQCNVDGWKDIVAISAGREFTIGLKNDGTAVAVGRSYYGATLDVSGWRNIVAIDANANGWHALGLKADGTVVATGNNEYEQCNVSGWTDIAAVAACGWQTVGFKSDGSVILTGSRQYNVGLWKDIKVPDLPTKALITSNAVPDQNDELAQENYNRGFEQMMNGNTLEALRYFREAGNYQDAKAQTAKLRKLWQTQPTFSTGLGNNPIGSGVSLYAVALKENGTVIAAGYNKYGQLHVSNWKDIIAVDTSNVHTVGLKADGTVVAVGMNDDGECNVSHWTDIVAISVGSHHTLGLKADGTVVATGNNKYGQCNVGKWKDIIAVSAGDGFTVGLKADGTVVAVGGDGNVSGWTDIIAIDAGAWHTVGLKADGTVVAVGSRTGGECNVSNWKDIIAVGAGDGFTVGLKADGTVVVTGKDKTGAHLVSDWTDIVAISAGSVQTVGLKKDGTMVSTTVSNEYKRNINAPFDISGWRDIKLPERPKLLNHATTISAGLQQCAHDAEWDVCAVAVRENGTVATAGCNKYGKLNVSGWNKIVSVVTTNLHTVGLKADGTVVAVGHNSDGQCDTSDWQDIVSVSAGMLHTVGLKKDGTVVAVGDNSNGQCNVSNWANIIAISTGNGYTIGLKKDGTMVTTDLHYQLNWKYIIAISAGAFHTVGLKADGTVVSSHPAYISSDFKDIVAVSAGREYTVALKADGTVVAAGNNTYGQCDVSDWTDIVAVSAGESLTLGLKADGTVVSTGLKEAGTVITTTHFDINGQSKDFTTKGCDVSGWKDIKIP